MLSLALKNISGKSFGALIKDKVNIVIELTKFRITTFVTLTTVFGFICATGEMTSSIIAPVIGVLLLSSGSAVVNHFQERDTDALMDRTKNRPIPSGRISAASALLISIILIISGSAVYFLRLAQ